MSFFSGEQQESIKTALWIGDCFIFTTNLNRLNYYVGGEIVTIAHLDRPLYLVWFYYERNNWPFKFIAIQLNWKTILDFFLNFFVWNF